MKIIAGLGNPGLKYAANRHNVGFMAVDMLAQKLGWEFSKTKHNAEIAEGHYKGEKIILLKPQTFMNLSGESVADAVNYYDISWQDVLMIYDDMDLLPGQLKVRSKGSAGGHRGMASVIAHAHTNEIPRVKIGIGHPLVGTVVDYVLQSFDKEAMAEMLPVLARAAEAAFYWLENDINQVMNIYNAPSAE